MWLWMWTALAITPDELALAADEAAEQLTICAQAGCEADEGARAAFVAAVQRYQQEGLADGDLAATVRFLDAELFADLPDVLRDAAGTPLPWASPPPVPDASVERPPIPESAQTTDGVPCGEPAASDQPARVVVLQWKGTNTRFDSPRLQRKLRALMDHPEVAFTADHDLYQAGRAEGFPDLVPRAVVPDHSVELVRQAAIDNAAIPDGALSREAWAERAQQLADLAEQVWFIDRPELREPLFLLYAQVGRAVELGKVEGEPWWAVYGERETNVYTHRAASLAHWEPGLLSALVDEELSASIQAQRKRIAASDPVRLSFALEDQVFDAEAFARQYVLFLDGREVAITNADGMLGVPPGRADVSVRTADGHALSERVEASDLGGQIYFVRNQAHRRIAFDLIQQLMETPYACSPELDDELRTHLAIYQQLHAGEDLYVVVPERGSAARSKLHLWRWDAEHRRLARMAN